jgi:hypothetical protein
MAVARHGPAMMVAMVHHYSLSDAAQLRTLLESATFRDVEVVKETRTFSFPSFEAYFEPFEQGGGRWGAEYAALTADTRRTIRDDVRRGLDRSLEAGCPLEIEVDILFGSGRK